MNKMIEYKLYIGSDNQTKQLDRDTIVEHASAMFNSFTYTEGEGFYEGKPESCAILIILAPARDVRVKELAMDLRIALNQECILLSCHEVDVEFV